MANLQYQIGSSGIKVVPSFILLTARHQGGWACTHIKNRGTGSRGGITHPQSWQWCPPPMTVLPGPQSWAAC